MSAVYRRQLDNGLTVLVLEAAAAPVAAATLLTSVGSRHETPETSGLTALLGRVLVKGTRTRSAVQIAQAAEDAGGEITTGTDQEYTELRVRGLARHWRALLALLHDVASAPTLSGEEIERERHVLLAHLRSLEDLPFEVGHRLLNRALYGPEGYGLSPGGATDAVARLSRDDLVGHLARHYTPERSALAIVGAVDGNEVMTEAARLFGSVPRGFGAPGLPSLPATPIGVRVEEHRPTQQTHLLIGYLAPPLGHADHVVAKVLNVVLGGGMSGRLFRVLRDQRGLAYSVGSFCPTRGGTGRIVVHMGTAPATATEAEAGILEVVETVRRTIVPEDELARATAYLAGAFALDLRTSARRSFYLAFYELLGVGHEYGERYPQLIGEVSADDLRRVAREILVSPTVVVVGPG